jgi:hypothetical protein
MTLFDQLDRWEEQGALTPEQHALQDGLSRGKPFSVFLELNILLYAGVLAFAGGLAWTVRVYSQQLGDVVILAVLSGILSACLWYCFSRASPYSAAETQSPNLILDYVLYLGSLIWSVELAYIESRFHFLSGQWDYYLLATSCFFFALAYRFDNRFVLSLALSALAGWFGLTISHWPESGEASYRQYAILYSLVVGAAGIGLQWTGIKRHFLGTYLNVAANVFFAAVLSGVFSRDGYLIWFLILIVACVASLAYGLLQKQFSFVAYAAVYGYIGVSSILLRNLNDSNAIFAYFVVTGIGMLVVLWLIARRFGRQA